MKRNVAFASPIALALALALAGPARAETLRRVALVVGANDGGADRPKLRYAHSDARSVSRVLAQLGGIDRRDTMVLIEPTREELRQALARLAAMLQRRSRPDQRLEIVFYYSGHSDERGLLLRGEHLTYLRLRQVIRNLPADVRIAVLDSCASGGIVTRSKGGIRRPPFVVSSADRVQGHAFLTSASADEAAQESDRVKGSYFTHYLVSGLRGAADSNGDGQITLNEAYHHAFHRTLARTEVSRSGPQHPNYDMQLAGRGEVVLTDVRRTSTILVLGADLRGRFFVRDARGELVAEVDKRKAAPVSLGLEQGVYRVSWQRPDEVRHGTFELAAKTTVTIGAVDLSERTPREAAVARGTAGPDAPAEAAVAQAAAPLIVTPVVLTILPTLGMGHARTVTYFSLGLIGSYYADLSGFDLTLGASVGTRDVDGVQISLGGAYTGRDLRGLQLSLGLNITGRDFKGSQITLGGNTVRRDFVSGLQLALGFNWVSRDVLGVQSAVGFNYAGGDMGGAQIGLGFNVARGLVDGTQIALGFNTAGDVDGGQVALGFNVAPRVDGLQVALLLNEAPVVNGVQIGSGLNRGGQVHGAQVGLINVGGQVRGAQVGLINIAGAVSTTQVGLINVAGQSDTPVGLLNLVRDGLHEVELWGSDSGAALVGAKLGGRYLYSLLAAGIMPRGETQRWMLGLGIGGRVPIGSRIYLDIDLVHYHVNRDEAWTSDVSFLDKLRLIFGYCFHPHLALFGGPTLNVSTSRVDDGSAFGLIPGRVTHDGETTVKVWPGFVVGLGF